MIEYYMEINSIKYIIFIPNKYNILWMKLLHCYIINDLIISLESIKYEYREDDYSFYYMQYLFEEKEDIYIPIYLSYLNFGQELICAFVECYLWHDRYNELSSYVDLFLIYNDKPNFLIEKLEYLYQKNKLNCFDISETYKLVNLLMDLLIIKS